jgi:hypothetical protein
MERNKTMMEKKLGRIIKKSDLNESQNKLVNIATLPEIKGTGALHRIGSKGVFVTNDSVFFLDLRLATIPKIINVLKLSKDPGGYANTFLGTYKNYALFDVGYIGLEIIDITDITQPKSIGLIKDYGPSLKMALKEPFAINQGGIFNISNLLTPKMLKRFEIPVFDLIVKGDSLIYSSSSEHGSIIQSIKLNKVKELNVSSTLSHELIIGDSIFKNMEGNYLLAASGNGIGIIDLKPPEERLSLISVINLEIDPHFLVFTGSSCIVRTIPYFGNLLVFFNFEDTLKPERYLTFDAGDLIYFTVNEQYLVYSSFENDGCQKKYILTVLRINLNSPPELIGSISAQDFSTFEVVNNVLYVFEKDGLKLYEIK